MPTDAAVIAMARALWPALTVGAASDAFLSASLLWARAADNGQVDPPSYLVRLAHLIAHRAYAVDPAGALGSGNTTGAPLTSIGTRELSNGYGSTSATGSASALTAWLATTAPGAEYLALRDSRAPIAAPFVGF